MKYPIINPKTSPSLTFPQDGDEENVGPQLLAASSISRQPAAASQRRKPVKQHTSASQRDSARERKRASARERKRAQLLARIAAAAAVPLIETAKDYQESDAPSHPTEPTTTSPAQAQLLQQAPGHMVPKSSIPNTPQQAQHIVSIYSLPHFPTP